MGRVRGFFLSSDRGLRSETLPNLKTTYGGEGQMAVYSREFTKRIDYPLIIILASLLLVGLLMVYSSSFDFAYRVMEQQPTYFFGKQIIWALLGTADDSDDEY